MKPSPLLKIVSSKASLRTAWTQIKKRNSSKGIDGVSIEEFRSRTDIEFEQIQKDLLSGEYKFQELRPHFLVKDPSKSDSGLRPLRIAVVRDRVVQKAIFNTIHNALEAEYKTEKNGVSFAYIDDTSSKDAIDQITEHRDNGYNWVLKSDIVNFFEAVDVSTLLEKMIYTVITDYSIRDLIAKAFAAEVGNKEWLEKNDKDDLFNTKGLPQGGILSPFFSNIYLSSFDNAMKKTNMKLVRYADDFIVLCKTEDEALGAFAYAAEILAQSELKLHPLPTDEKKEEEEKKSMITNFNNGFDFIGYRFDQNYVYPSAKSYKRTKEKLAINQGRRLIDALTRYRNISSSWGVRYFFCEYEEELYSELDSLLIRSVERMFEKHGLEPKYGAMRDRDLRKIGITTFSKNYKRAKERDAKDDQNN